MSIKIIHRCPNCALEILIEEHVSIEQTNSQNTSQTCSFCLFEEKNGLVIHPGKQWNNISEIEVDLHNWYLKNQLFVTLTPTLTKTQNRDHVDQQEDQEIRFFEQNFHGKSRKELATHIFDQKSIATDFDVIDYLFFGVMHPKEQKNSPVPQIHSIQFTKNEEQQTQSITPIQGTITESQAYHEEDILLRVLYSVILGDGKILDAEQRALESICHHWNRDLPHSDRRVWRPVELPIPKDPERILQFAIEIAVSDEEIDQTEWRIIEEFSRYWSVESTRLEELRAKYWNPKPNKLHRIFTAIHNLFFTESP